MAEEDRNLRDCPDCKGGTVTTTEMDPAMSVALGIAVNLPILPVMHDVERECSTCGGTGKVSR